MGEGESIPFVQRMMQVGFTRAQRSRAPRRLGLADAAPAFFDENRMERFDGRDAHGEDPWVTRGNASGVVLEVAYTMRGDDVIRLISAQKADGHEEAEYWPR